MIRFRVTKEELIRLIDSLEDGELIHSKDRILEGELVEEVKGLKELNNITAICEKDELQLKQFKPLQPPQPIEEIDSPEKEFIRRQMNLIIDNLKLSSNLIFDPNREHNKRL